MAEPKCRSSSPCLKLTAVSTSLHGIPKIIQNSWNSFARVPWRNLSNSTLRNEQFHTRKPSFMLISNRVIFPCQICHRKHIVLRLDSEELSQEVLIRERSCLVWLAWREGRRLWKAFGMKEGWWKWCDIFVYLNSLSLVCVFRSWLQVVSGQT